MTSEVELNDILGTRLFQKLRDARLAADEYAQAFSAQVSILKLAKQPWGGRYACVLGYRVGAAGYAEPRLPWGLE